MCTRILESDSCRIGTFNKSVLYLLYKELNMFIGPLEGLTWQFDHHSMTRLGKKKSWAQLSASTRHIGPR